MNISINKVLAITAIGSSIFAANSQAAGVNLSGTSSIYVTNVTISGPDLSAPGNIVMVNPSYGTNTGDYTALAVNAPFTFTSPLTLGDPSSWDITGPIATHGFYTVSSLNVPFQSADFLNVHTLGMFTPGTIEGTQPGGCNTGGNNCLPTDTVLRWSFTRSFDPGTGNYSLSASGTLASPSSLFDVPEPTSLSLLAVGLAGWVANRRLSAKTQIACAK